MASFAETIQKPVDVMRRLERQIRDLESLQRAHTGVFSSGCHAMDTFLPHGGYTCGSLVEFIADKHVTEGSIGLTTLALQIAKSVCESGKYLVVIDPDLQLFPPALKQLGVPLERLICLRPKNYSDLVWGMDQVLRNASVGSVIASMERVDDRVARRIQLAAEAGGGLGILLRSLESVRYHSSWAEVQWMVHSVPLQQQTEVRWFDLVLRRSPGGYAPSSTNASNPRESWQGGLAGGAALSAQAGGGLRERGGRRGRVGGRLRVGIDGSGEWVVSAEQANSVTAKSVLAKSEARNDQAGHVRLAAELASSARDRRSLAG